MDELLSKSQIDLLGDRLKSGTASEDDFRRLDVYRRSFMVADAEVTAQIIVRVGLPHTGRSKTNASIIQKLRRQSIRLSQVQDIAGRRIVVPEVQVQDQVVADLRGALPGIKVEDLREKPSHGYRAVHLIIPVLDRFVEVQVRTDCQHGWADLSEKLSDVIDPSIKYGGGPDEIAQAMLHLSNLFAKHELAEVAFIEMRKRVQSESSTESPEWRRMVVESRELLNSSRQTVEWLLQSVNDWVEKMKRERE